MKKTVSIIVWVVLVLQQLSPLAQTGGNAFNTHFNNAATSLDMKNAYLLGYLSTTVYADYIRYLYSPVPGANSSFVKSIKDDDDKFVIEYAKKISYLFTSASSLTPPINNNRVITKTAITADKITGVAVQPEPSISFDFIHKCNPSGYDPEAVLISTPATVYVVFRGTDRVSCNISPAGYQWAEWMGTDFKFLKRDASFIHPQIQGQVHRGMAESLVSQNFADELASAVAAVIKNKTTGATKKVWITGHSLGGGHAQLFAMFLKYNYNITAQGLYIYEAPHPGDAAFVSQLNSDIGKNRIQRFEFGDDPIPTLPPQAFFYGRAGVRNYFKDYRSAMQAGEQIAAVDDLRILCVLGNLPGEQIPQFAKLQFPPLCPGSTCFHHPTFILEAIRHQLSTALLPALPPAVPVPLAGDNCNQGDLTKAENNDLINNTATAVENIIADVAWQAGNMLDNLLGSGIQEGTYKIACYGFKNNAKKYLKWDGTTNHQLNISSTGTIFNITHKLTGGYQIWSFGANMAADVKFSFGIPTGEENTNNVIMKSKDIVVGDEETWYFFKVPNKTNTYVLYNWNSHKVLDAPNDCLTASSCPVNEFGAKSNAPTQVWILEKPN